MSDIPPVHKLLPGHHLQKGTPLMFDGYHKHPMFKNQFIHVGMVVIGTPPLFYKVVYDGTEGPDQPLNLVRVTPTHAEECFRQMSDSGQPIDRIVVQPDAQGWEQMCKADMSFMT